MFILYDIIINSELHTSSYCNFCKIYLLKIVYFISSLYHMMNENIENTEFLLNWHIEAGVDETIAEMPCNFFESDKIVKPKSDIKTTVQTTSQQIETNRQNVVSDSTNLSIQNANKLVENIEKVEDLENIVNNFDGCGLKVTAKNTVFGEGNTEAKILIIGEAPGADEDRIGRPFVGKSGILLDKMLKSIELDRSNVYISNTIYWRPPGNRTPTSSEISICLPFVKKLVEIMKPEIIITLGGSATQTILNTNETISKLRGRWIDYSDSENNKTEVIATFHPSYLLRNPANKKKSWADLLKIKKKISS